MINKTFENQQIVHDRVERYDATSLTLSIVNNLLATLSETEKTC